MARLIELLIALLMSLVGAQAPASVPASEPVPDVVPCTTDADCIEKNPHINEDPQCEWVGDACVYEPSIEDRLAEQARPDWSSGGETVCVLDPEACEGFGDDNNEGETR